MTLENTQEDTELELNSNTDPAATELKPKFQALPKCLLVNENEIDELQPEPNNTPRPKQSA